MPKDSSHVFTGHWYFLYTLSWGGWWLVAAVTAACAPCVSKCLSLRTSESLRLTLSMSLSSPTLSLKIYRFLLVTPNFLLTQFLPTS